MLTALVLQLIQCVVVLPDRLGRNTAAAAKPSNTKDSKKDVKKENNSKGNKDNEGEGRTGEELHDPEAGMDRDVVVNLR